MMGLNTTSSTRFKPVHETEYHQRRWDFHLHSYITDDVFSDRRLQ